MNTNQSYYDIEEFPELKGLCKNWKIIKMEYLNLNAPLMNINRINKCHEDVFEEVSNQVIKGEKFGWVQGWGEDGGNKNWIQYGLILNGFKIPFLKKEMIQTTQLLMNIKGITTSALLKLKPLSVLHLHRHDDIRENSLLQLHLPILTPHESNYNYLNVQGEFRQYQEGVPIIFDGSLDHFALNESRFDRTTLYIEFKKDILRR